MSPEMEHYHRGALSASLWALTGPVHGACSVARQVLSQARNAQPCGVDQRDMLANAERLEAAAKALREAAALASPTLTLMAAE